MNEPWMVWAPGAAATRVMVTSGTDIILKARLSPGPSHPRAVQWLMEAIALWEGAPVRAVISADVDRGICAKSFWDVVDFDFGGALYSLDFTSSKPRKTRQLSIFDDLVPEVGGFSDLEEVRLADAVGGGR